MKSLVSDLPSVSFSDGIVSVFFSDGASLRFPVAGNPRLAAGSPSQLSHVEVSPFGIHWPDLDEDLSFAGLARGDYGQHTRPAP